MLGGSWRLSADFFRVHSPTLFPPNEAQPEQGFWKIFAQTRKKYTSEDDGETHSLEVGLSLGDISGELLDLGLSFR